MTATQTLLTPGEYEQAIRFPTVELARIIADHVEARERSWHAEVLTTTKGDYVLAVHDTADREYVFLGYL